MEVEEMQSPGCKFPRIRNRSGRINDDSGKIGQKGDDQYNPEEDEADGEELKKANVNGGGTGGGGGLAGLDISAPAGLGRLCGWPSSRIVRVSRASGGKDRHSKVWTSKGLRDRRVRLSVNTAIQFYDLQDRLGYDQPSKAVEWLLKAAAGSIAELPSINTSFPDTPQQLSDEKRSSAGTHEHGFDSTEVEMESELNYHQQQQQQHHGTFSKSACSSTSETSKGSGLSLSRSESRIKARERARERAAEKEKDKEKEESSLVAHQPHHNVNPISQNSSFTELLTSGIGNSANVGNTNTTNNTSSPNGGAASIHQNTGRGGSSGGGNSKNAAANESNFFQKSSPRHWCSSTPMDCFATGLLGLSSSRATHQSSAASFLGQIQLNNPLHQSLTSVSSPLFTVTADHHHHHHHHPALPHFSFVPDHLVPVVTEAGGNGNNHSNNTGNGNGGNSDYNLNFTISPSSSSGLAGFNRGTLQSNSSSSPSLLPHVQRFSPIDGPSSAFFTSTTATLPNAAVAPVENHHQHHHHHHFLPGFDARLQLCYGDGGRHSDQKAKGKH